MGVALVLSTASTIGCGIEWSVPSNHFDGVNEMGELSYWREIGKLDLGNDLKIPLILGFKPNRGGASCLSRGWLLPILDSNVVQVDECRFLLTQPDGITRRFKRKMPTDSSLDGEGNWKGEIRGNTITLWAACGWKLIFSKGRIASITTPKNRTFNIVQSNGQVSELQEQGRPVLRVERDQNGAVNGLSFGLNRVKIEMGEMPRVEVIQGANVIGGVEKTVHSITLPDKKQAIYEFGVDEKKQPTLKISGDTFRTFTWAPVTGKLLKDGEWTYDIKPGRAWANAKIARTNSNGRSESWHYDTACSVEVEERLNGDKIVKTYFSSGLLAGRIRSTTFQNNEQEPKIWQNVYDEKGLLVREEREDGQILQYTYDSSRRLLTARDINSNKNVLERKYDSGGREIYYRNGNIEYIHYYKDSQVIKDSPKLAKLFSANSLSELIEVITPGVETQYIDIKK